MQPLSNATTMTPTIAEQRPPVLIQVPFEGSPKKLRAEFAKLRARIDALETDKNNAALHRADFMRELDSLTEAQTEATKATQGKPKTTHQAVAEETGIVDLESDKSITWEATQIRDISVGILRKELALRSDLGGYSDRWLVEGQKAVVTLRAKLTETRAGVMGWLVKGHSHYGGYDDPTTNKLSPCRVLPGYVFSHPAVVAAKNELQTVQELVREKTIYVNRREIQELRRLIRSEAARLAGLSVEHVVILWLSLGLKTSPSDVTIDFRDEDGHRNNDKCRKCERVISN
jgi:hypothetical protein